MKNGVNNGTTFSAKAANVAYNAAMKDRDTAGDDVNRAKRILEAMEMVLVVKEDEAADAWGAVEAACGKLRKRLGILR